MLLPQPHPPVMVYGHLVLKALNTVSYPAHFQILPHNLVFNREITEHLQVEVSITT